MSPDGHRRSREGWADAMEAGPPNPPAHTHRLPKVVRLAIVGLVAAVFLLAVALGLMAVQVYKANQYVQGRGEYRDREAARMEQEFKERDRRSICDLLDQFPATPLLDTVRDKYDCGPGRPLEEFPEDVQREIGGDPSVVPPETPPGVEFAPDGFDFSAGASPDGGPAEPYFPEPGEPEPEPTVPIPDGFPPPDPVQPLTETACGVVGVCP